MPELKGLGIRAIAIGASTGAPNLVREILSLQPADLPCPILVAQHLPPAFTESFANRIAQSSPLQVYHAEQGMEVFPGVAYVGQGHRHMRVKGSRTGRMTLEISTEPKELHFMPSADELFRSCAHAFHGPVLAVVLTGIGHDGTHGAEVVRQRGGVVVAQDEASSAVYGMPRSVYEAGHCDARLTPKNIARLIRQLAA